MRLQRLSDIEDPRADDYRNVKDADLVGRRGLFMAEGELVVRTLALRGRFAIKSALMTETRWESIRDSLEGVCDEAPVYLASQEMLDRIAGFHLHRGCLAVGVRGEEASPVELLNRLDADDQTGAIVVMEDLANHDNVGGVFRNAAAFGAGAALLTRRSCDPLYRKAIRVSMGATLTTPWAITDDIGACLAMLRASGRATIALTPRPDAVELNELNGLVAPRARVALLLGAEGAGLSEKALEGAEVCVKIPMAPGVDSLNVATASGVALYAINALRHR